MQKIMVLPLNKRPLLSICIPTYNRAEILRGNLASIQQQLKNIDMSELELIVSNNCSPDHTEEVVMSFIKAGMPIIYNCNNENIGADGNILRVMNVASGKYIYLLGDDDYLCDGAISNLFGVLRTYDCGLIYINDHNAINRVEVVYDQNEFIRRVSYFYTFMSGCIFRKEAINSVTNPERYVNSCLLQLPFYLTSTKLCDYNIVVGFPVLRQVGIDSRNNGGYNFFEVFVCNYLNILKEYIDDASLFKWLKKDIWPFVFGYTKRLLVRNNIGNFKIKNGWEILFRYYWNELYFWWSWIKYPFCIIKNRFHQLT